MTPNPNKLGLRIGFLDGLRGLASLYVMLGHARWLLWEGFNDGFSHHPEQYSLAGKIVAYLSLTVYYGHQAVVFFFVLSGFVIHLRYARLIKEDNKTESRFDLFPFLLRRLRRIYPLYLFAILATFMIDQAGISQHYPIYFQNTPYALINQNIAQDFSVQTALGNIFMVPNTPAWGSNGPLWSLRLEWWFYLLYPLFWFVTRRSIKLATAVVISLYLLTFVTGLWPNNILQSVFAAFPAWWLGVLLADVYAGRLKSRFSRIAPLGGLFVVLPFLVAPFVEINQAVQDLLWALGFTGIIAACLAWQNRNGSLALLERLHFLGNISYSLYVLHFPILALMGGWLMSRSPDNTLPQDFGWIGLGVVVCTGVAYLAHMLIERPFLKL